MKINKTAIYHITFWVLYIIYVVLGIYVYNDPAKSHSPGWFMHQSMFNMSYTLSEAALFYYIYFAVLPLIFRKGKQRLLFVPALLGAPFVFIAARYGLEEIFYPVVFGFRNYDPDTTFSFYILDNLYRGTPTMAIAAAVWGVQRAYQQQQENKSLREEKIRAELAFLKSQVNPHFLYNTLNYIYSMAYPVSDELADAVIKLSQLMRYMLTESPDGMMDLQKEVDYLDNYIAIYRMRFADHFFVDFKVDGDIAGKRVASLVLIPFVENAFKHGVVDDPSRPVRIGLKVTGSRMEFTVSNKISQQQKDHSSGVGLANIRRRLELIYPGKHDLLVSANGQTYKSTLYINLT